MTGTAGRPRVRADAESTIVLEVAMLLRSGRIRVGTTTTGALAWGNAETVASMSFTASLGEIDGRMTIRHPGGEPYELRLVSTALSIGCRRWLFLCPVENRPTMSLYLPVGADRFASRQAHRLIYRTQRLGKAARAAERERRARLALGGSGDLGKPFPERPARMRRSTYERLRGRALGSDEAAEATSTPAG